MSFTEEYAEFQRVKSDILKKIDINEMVLKLTILNDCGLLHIFRDNQELRGFDVSEIFNGGNKAINIGVYGGEEEC